MDTINKIKAFFTMSKSRKYRILNRVRKLLKIAEDSCYFAAQELEVEKVQCEFSLSLTEYQLHEKNRTLHKEVIKRYTEALMRARMLKVHIAVDTRLGQYIIRATGAVIDPKAVIKDAPTMLDKMQNEN